MSRINAKSVVAGLAVAVLALSLSSGPAKAQLQTRTLYAAKFLCGQFPGNANLEGPVKPGNYQTAINVHNPRNVPLTFTKKAVLLYRADQPPTDFERPMPPGQIFTATLNPDWGLEIDCRDIRFVLLGGAAAAPPAPIFIKGWVIIQTFGSKDLLDVVAAYPSHGFTTTTPPQPEGFSTEIETVVGRVIP